MKKIILLCTIYFLGCAAYSQTTIGSDNEPVKGALLDLKQNTSALENSVKGMVLPRVNLVNLKPAATGANNLPASIGSPASESWDLEDHIGLMVYNVYRCPAGRTVYNETGPQVWDGSRWELLTKPTLAEATPAETSGVNTWGKGVVHHAAKPNPGYVAGTDPGYLKNIYEEFYSADFGTAGRWMTTNLTAWKYDSGIPASTILPQNADISLSHTEIRWCYPGTSATGGTNDEAYLEDPLVGLLYNWPAATGKQNTSTDYGQGQVLGSTPGSYEVETLYGSIQGICPDGWHLPSDREWNILEKEMYENPERYATYTASELPFKTTYNTGVATGSNGTAQAGWRTEWETGQAYNSPPGTIGGYGWRGANTNYSPAPGQGMKNICTIRVDHQPTAGRSKSVADGGFNLMMSGGRISSGIAGFGGVAYMWCSSSSYASAGWDRYWSREASMVGRSGANEKSWFYSVRCVKD